MTKRSSLHTIAAVALLVGATAPPAYADPVTVLMTGGLLDYTILNEARLGLQFPNGSATIVWQDEHDEWRPDFERGCCTAGDTLNLSTTESLPQPFVGFGGELVFGSDIYSVTKLSFSVVALRDVIVPVLGEGEFRSFTGIPFTFRGTVGGVAPDQRTLALDLIGSGHASTAVSFLTPTESFLEFAHYNFDANPASPVPEPGTWLLVATGLGAVVRRMGKNRQG